MRCPECDSDRVVRTGSTGDQDMYIRVWYECRSCDNSFSDLEDNSADSSGA